MLLEIVAIPLGNAGDLSLRAKNSIISADIIVCEDSRKVQSLLSFAGLTSSARILPIPAAKEESFQWNTFIEENTGKRVVLLSDAGTPIVNDPGRHLIGAMQKKSLAYQAIPGPCAPILALQWSGGFGLPVYFAGFVPRKKMEDFFKKGLSCKTFIFFETKHHFEASFEVMLSLGWGSRRMYVAREMTKAHEQLLRGDVESVFAELKRVRNENSGALGEMTFVLEGDGAALPKETLSLKDIQAIRCGSVKMASKLLAKITDLSASELYQEMSQWKP